MHDSETEIIFLAMDAQLERLSAVLRQLVPTVRPHPLRRVQDRYLDTPSCLLMRCGVACRLRRIGKRATLTLKSLTPLRAGMAERAELSEELQTADWQEPAPLPGALIRSRLRPITRHLAASCLFTLNQERRVFDVQTPDGTNLEVSADRVRLSGACRDTLLRIEVELRSGSVDALTRFASELRRRMKLKTASESKFEWGMRAAGLAAPVLTEGKRFRLCRDDTVQQAAGRALMRHYRRMLWHFAGTYLGLNPESLHDMRVSVRRLRAVLRVFRGFLPAAGADKLDEELRWLGQSLGAVRDLDVHLEECAALRERIPAPERSAVIHCRAEMIRRRELASDRLRNALQSPRFRRLKHDCRTFIRNLLTAAPGRQRAADAGLLRPSDLKKILRTGRAITLETPDQSLHRLRVRCKRLRYACETLGDLYGKPVTRLARRLAALQDVLGRHQDAATAQQLISKMTTESAAAKLRDPAIAQAVKACADVWQHERLIRRAACPKAWKAFDRKKMRRAFRKTVREHIPRTTRKGPARQEDPGKPRPSALRR